VSVETAIVPIAVPDEKREAEPIFGYRDDNLLDIGFGALFQVALKFFYGIKREYICTFALDRYCLVCHVYILQRFGDDFKRL